MKKIFIISLPRSGSTLLQKILAASPDVITASEPWVLIPLINIYKDRFKSFSTFNQVSFRDAVNDLKTDVGDSSFREGGRAYYNAIIEGFSSAPDKVFLDKTPRYHLMADEIYRLFPDAVFIILVRNPLSITSSICNSWKRGVFDIQDYYIDLYDGFEKIAEFQRENQGNKNVITIRYEDLVSHDFDWLKIFDFCGVTYPQGGVDDFSNVQLKGKMGDKVGEKKYDKISEESKESWAGFYSNSLRRRWAYKYLEENKSYLQDVSYCPEEIKGKIRSKAQKGMFSDVAAMTKGILNRFFCLSIIMHNLKCTKKRALR